MISTLDQPKKQLLNETMLTYIELEILQMIADGKTERGISEKLKIDEHKVDFHQNLLLKAFNVSDIDNLVMIAMQKGYVN